MSKQKEEDGDSAYVCSMTNYEKRTELRPINEVIEVNKYIFH